MTQPVIRKATPADMAGVHALVRELALYEKAPDQVITDPESFQLDLSDRWFDCLVAEAAGGEIVGIALYYRAYSTWRGRMIYLDDLVVKESERGNGTGLRLLKALARVGLDEKATRIKWQVLDWNAPAIRFYERLGAEISQEWYNCTLETAEMQALAEG